MDTVVNTPSPQLSQLDIGCLIAFLVPVIIGTIAEFVK